MMRVPNLADLERDPAFDVAHPADLLLMLGAAADAPDEDLEHIRRTWALPANAAEQLAEFLAASDPDPGGFVPADRYERAARGAARVFPDEPLGGVISQYIAATVAPVPGGDSAAADPLTTVSRWIQALRAAPDDRGAGTSLIGALLSGPLYEAMVRGAREFDDGIESEADAWVALAVEGRIVLDDLAATDDAALVACAQIDAALAPYRDAVLLLEPDVYESLVQGAYVDRDAWWGRRGALEAAAGRTSLREIDRALHPVGATRSTSAGLVTRADGAWAPAHESGITAATLWAASEVAPPARSVPPSAPCEWLAAPVVRIPLLLWREDGVGVVVGLHMHHDRDGHVWSFDHPLKAVAFDALRRAWRLAATRMPGGRPRWPLHEHRVELSGIDPMVRVDGPSLALPFALAFAALWLDRGLDDDLCATGDLRDPDGSVGRVGRVPEKAAALAAAWRRSGRPRLLVPPEHAVPVDGVDVIEVHTLDVALRHAKLDPSGARFDPAGWSESDRVADVTRLVRAVEDQALGPWRRVPGVDPWVLLADELRQLVETVEREDPTLAAAGRAAAALAYTHAGEDGTVMVRGIDRAALPPEVAVLVDIAEFNGKIDAVTLLGDADDLRARGDRLLADVATLHVAHRRLIEGKALGTVGHALLHLRDPAAALPILRRAVEAHTDTERGRGRVGVAMALRTLGRLESALDELDQARGDFVRTGDRSPAYFTQCDMYWRYERARVLLAAARHEEAAQFAREALSASEYGGFWPRLGILRTLAQALRRLGDEEGAAASLARMRGESVPPGLAGFAGRLIAEACGPVVLEGEVY